MPRRSLQRDLEVMERTVPKVRDAAKKYAETVDAMIDHGTVTIETTTEPDGMGRQRFSVVWWDGSFHLGPRWRGQHYFMRMDEFLKMPGSVAKGRRVIQRHRLEQGK